LAGSLDVQGGTITESTGALSITTGASNGSITLDPDGTGSVALTLANGGNLTNTRNYVLGAIRNSTVEAAGNMWGFLSGSGTGFRGISIDNSADTAKGPLEVIRGYTGGASAPGPTTPRLSFERARGTSASPTAIQSGDLIGQIVATGANGANTFIGDAVAAQPASMQFLAAENFSSTTNVGTQFTLSLMPTGKTLASVATPTTVFGTTPQSTTSRSDSFTWQSGNTTALPGSTTIGSLIANDGSSKVSFTVSKTNATSGSEYALINFDTARSSGGTYSPTQSGDTIGQFKFNGNALSGASPGGTSGPGVSITATATETWTTSAQGTAVSFSANKIGAITQTTVISASPDTLNLSSDVITLENSSGTDYAVLNANTAKFNVPVTTEITTTTISEGTTYTPAATVDNNISVQLNADGGGTTVIDLTSLTGNNRGGSYNILVFNNTGSGAAIQVKNTRISSGNLMTHTITTGAPRIIINAYVVGDYATATHLVVA
jgi:hypothetical protein